MKRLKNKNGFSLMEVIIALSAVVVVSMASLVIMLNSMSAAKKNADQAAAQHFADDVVACFTVANDADELCALMAYAESDESIRDLTINDWVPDDVLVPVGFEDGVRTYTYVSEEHQFSATIKVCFAEELPERLRTAKAGDTFVRPVSYITVTVTGLSDSEPTTVTYKKGL